jgi:DNA-binding Lrp family transcriptional regulator
VLERIRRWCAEGIIKRFGVIVRHHELGYTANAMLVHDIPDEAVEEIGETPGARSGRDLVLSASARAAGVALQPVLHDPRPGARRSRGADRRAARPPAPRATTRTTFSSRSPASSRAARAMREARRFKPPVIDAIDRAIIDGLQGGFPICERPYAKRRALGISEEQLLGASATACSTRAC